MGSPFYPLKKSELFNTNYWGLVAPMEKAYVAMDGAKCPLEWVPQAQAGNRY